MGAVADRVERALAPALAGRELDLESVEVQPAGRRRLVRVLVDRDGGISLDEVAELSHELGAVLDESDAMGEQPYVLEVSSPGVDRPLTLPRHFRRARGRLVNIRRADGDSVSGRIRAADDASVSVATEAGTVSIALADVAQAHLEVEFTHPSDETNKE